MIINNKLNDVTKDIQVVCGPYEGGELIGTSWNVFEMDIVPKCWREMEKNHGNSQAASRQLCNHEEAERDQDASPKALRRKSASEGGHRKMAEAEYFW